MTFNKLKSTIQTCIVLFSFLPFFSTFSCQQVKSKEEHLSTRQKNALYPVAFKQEIVDFATAREMIKNKTVVIIDLRSIEVYHAGHIPHAISLDGQAPKFMSQLRNFPIQHHYLLYGESEEQTAEAAKAFLSSGYLSVKEYRAGWDDWQKRGGSIER
jgi:rhodanese-related sulfurtransferase